MVLRIASLDSLLSRHRRKDDGTGRALLTKAGHAELMIKADEGAPEGTIEGYGSVFGAVDSYGERVRKGAFKKSLKTWKQRKKPIPMLWQHRSDQPIGVWPHFEEDEKGLFMRGQINLDIQLGREAWALIKQDAVTGLSIGYYEILAESWDRPANEPRDLIELDLRETSPVTFPALREAQIDAVKAIRAQGRLPTERELEPWLREQLGLTRSQAATFVGKGWKEVLLRDARGEKDEGLVSLVKAVGELSLPDLQF